MMLKPMQRLAQTPSVVVRRRFCTFDGASFSSEVLWAVPRSGAGTTVAKKERAQGRVPGVVFEQTNGQSGGNKRLISANQKQIERLLHKLGTSSFLSRTFTLEVFTHSVTADLEFRGTVLPRTVHVHAGTGKLLNITFMRTSPRTRLRVNVPLAFLGEDDCPGIRKGGYLNTIRRTACYDCPGDAIPQYLEVDLGGLDIGSIVLLKDIPVGPGLEIHGAQGSWPVCKIMGSRHVESAKA